MLKAGVSAHAISKKFNVSYSRQKNQQKNPPKNKKKEQQLCAKLKSSGDCIRILGSEWKGKIEETFYR